MRLLFILLVSFISVFVITACQKEVDFDASNPANPNPPVASTGNFRAKINGTQWVANKAAGAARFGGVINLSGLSNDRKILTITLTDSGVHRYILSDITMNAAAMVDSNDANPFSFVSNQGTYPTTSGGEVNITAIDTAKKTMTGTFSFKMYRDMDSTMKTITEGSFTNLSYATSMPPSAATDTFRVKIDGVSWTPASVMGVAVPIMNQIAVNATSSNASKTVGLTFPSTITAGTYTLDILGFTYIGQYNPDTDPMHSKASVSGTLTILEHNTSTKRIRGNFNFRGEEIATPANFSNITEGYFSVKYN
jgi:hypothetical protein